MKSRNLVSAVLSVCCLASVLTTTPARSDDEPKNCKLTVRTTVTDGDKRKVSVKVFDVYAVDQADCKAQATAAEADNDDPEHKTIVVSHGFRRTKLK